MKAGPTTNPHRWMLLAALSLVVGCSEEPVEEIEQIADDLCDCDTVWCVESTSRKMELKVQPFESGEQATAKKRWGNDVLERWNKAQAKAKDCATKIRESKKE